MQYELLDKGADSLGSVSLNEVIFDSHISSASIYESIKNLLANKRQGTSSTKTRGTVNGSTKKPWRQKGTGRARAGSRKSPLWRGKAVIFGPHPKDYSYAIPRKIKRKALFSVLTKARRQGNLKILDDFQIDGFKTKLIVEIFSKLSDQRRVLFITSCGSDNKNYEKIKKSSSNIPWLKTINVNSIEIKDLYYAKDVIFSKSALEVINQRYSSNERLKIGGANA